MGIRHDAISYLIDFCPDASITKSTLVDALERDDGGLRCKAAYFLLKHDPVMAPRALDRLVEQLLTPRDGGDLPWDVIKHLRESSPNSVGQVVSRLLEPLNRTELADQRLNAIFTLDAIGSADARPAIPALEKAVNSSNRTVASRAVQVLAKLDPTSAASHIPLLLDWIKPGEDVAIRLKAMATLGELGRAAEAAVPALLEISNEDEIRVSSAAIAALSRIDPARAAELKRSIRGGEAR